MKIILINVSGRLSTDGSRLISALLKRAGHEVKSIFLARPDPLEYEKAELELMDDILKKADLAMVAVYSSYAIRAIQITQFIRNKCPGMKVIWGGPHCISAPELALRWADAVCFSEGDQVVVDLVNKIEAKSEYLDTPNMAFRSNGATITNRVMPPFTKLDSLPHYDYDLEDQFLLDQGLFQMNKEILRERLAGYPYYIPILYLVTSRGCPHRCSYCNNARYISMFGHNTIRFHSIERVVNELERILRLLDFVQFIGFGDDDFFIRPEQQLVEFSAKYKERIGLPFGVAVSASTFSRRKMEILLDCGLAAIQMGVQSGSPRILEGVYNRKIKVSKTKNVMAEINSFQEKHHLDVFLDFIIDNPYETRDDIFETFKYLSELPDNVKINLFFLAFFPGTPLYDRALSDGTIDSFNEKAFRFYTRSEIIYQKNYETFLILLLRSLKHHPQVIRYFPRSLWRLLGSDPARKIASFIPKPVYAYLSKVLHAL